MSIFVRQPVIPNDVRDTILKPKLTELWNDSSNLTAKEIAEILDFGVPGTVFEKLKPYHVWFYRSYFKLPPRREREKGGSRYKEKKQDLMTWQTFIETLEEKLPPLSFLSKRQRSFLILLYWTPLRKSEIYERTRTDFEIKTKEKILTIDLFRKKKKYDHGDKSEPLNVPLVFPKMDEVVDYLEKEEWKSFETNPKNRPWKISHQTAWNYVREIFEGYYPHFFRFNWITTEANDPNVSFDELKTKTGLHMITLNAYLLESERFQTTLDKRKIERLKKEGVIQNE